MLRTAFAAALTAALLLPAAAAPAATGPAPLSPNQPQAVGYAVKVEQAYKYEWQTTATVVTRVTKAAPSSLRPVAAAGETVAIDLWADHAYGGVTIESCTGKTNAEGRLHCELHTASPWGGDYTLQVNAYRMTPYAAERDSRTVDIICHC